MLDLMPPPAPAPWPELDSSQRRAVDHRGPLLVTGAPGTGRTTTALAVVEQRVRTGELSIDDVLLLAPTRRAAARLRDELSSRLRITASAPVVRTASSVAFSILRRRAALLGEPAPTLISGPEQDLVLSELLAGHQEGSGIAVPWPAGTTPQVLGLRAFRDELRDLLMRAAERGLGPADLDRLGTRHEQPRWSAAAVVYREYLDVMSLRGGTPDVGARYDPAVIVDEATEALATWPDSASDTPRPSWRLVVVDDYQEATAATVRLLHRMASDGAEVVLMADPDVAVQTFRGASPGLTGRANLPDQSELGAFGADVITLQRVWRHGTAIREVVARVTAEIPGPERRHRTVPGTDRRSPQAELNPGLAEVHLLRSAAQQAADIAHLLRSAHLHERLPWDQMAVVVRSGAQLAALHRALQSARVPVTVEGSDLPLRAEPSVRPLLIALECVLDPAELAEHAATLLTSPIGGLDAVGLRRVRRALRAEEIAGGGGRTSDVLLVEALGNPAHAESLPAEQRGPVRAVARVLRAGRDALDDGVLGVLWAMWSTTGLAESWRRIALAGGPGAARADQDLDAVLALFTAAEQFVDRLPQASPRAFVDHLAAQSLPADTLAAHADLGDRVRVLTAASAAGRQWELVVVAGVQEGVWPDLRLRDSMLGAAHLVEVLSGRAGVRQSPREARAAILADELRTFAAAVSRARTRLVVTAVRDADEQPSALVDLVVPHDGEGPDPRLREVPPPLDLRAVVARARIEVETDPGSVAARLLADLADHGVEGADPEAWYGTRALSTDAPLWPVGGPVPMSPSKVEQAVNCALRWALEQAGGTTSQSMDQSLGTLLHAVMALLPHGSEAELAAAVEQRWSELGLLDGWVDRRARRRAAQMVRKLALYLARADESVAQEAEFRVDLGRIRVHGFVDRLEKAGVGDDGRPLLRVVDLKTGGEAVTQAAAAEHPQLGVYQAALDAGSFDDALPGARAGGATLLYVGTSTVSPTQRTQVAPADAENPRWVHDLLDELADVVTNAAMCATRNAECRHCPVVRSCPAQPEGRVVGA